MVRSTIIVRASDALPLAASVDDEQVGRHSTSMFHNTKVEMRVGVMALD